MNRSTKSATDDDWGSDSMFSMRSPRLDYTASSQSTVMILSYFENAKNPIDCGVKKII